MANEPIGRDEFEDRITAAEERITRSSDRGFDAINKRLDLLNGRTLKGEVEREGLRQRVVTVEREMKSLFRFLHSDAGRKRTDDEAGDGERPPARMQRRSDLAGSAETWGGALTKREYTLILAGIGVIGTALKLIEVLTTKVFALLAAGGHP